MNMSESTSAGEASKDSNLSETACFRKRYHRLLESDFSSDCAFIVGSQNVVIRGHKIIFATASEVFQAMFYSELKEDDEVKIEDLDPDGFQGMKQFIYTDEVNFTSVIHALKIYCAARKYLIPALSQVCIKYIKERVQPSEVLELYEYCKTNQTSEFDDICYKMIQERTDEVVKSEYFVAASIDAMELILKSPSLKLKSEIEVFVHFERWALAEADRKGISVEKMASSFNGLKKHIRFLSVGADDFLAKVEESLLLTLEEKHAIALNQMRTDSKPLPENLSMTQERRKFAPLYGPLKSENYPYKFDISVPLYGRPSEIDLPLINTYGVSLKIIFEIFGKDRFYFLVKPQITTGDLHTFNDILLLMKTKLTVMTNYYHNHLKENEFKIVVNMANIDHPGVVFADIRRYDDSDRVAGVIEVLYNVKRIV